MSSNTKQSFMGGAALLTLTMVITKLIGALFKIPIANLLDKEGMSAFYAAYNIYNLLLVISTAGLPLALSRLVSEAEALGHENQKRRVFRTASTLFLTLGVLCSAVMFFLAQPLAALLHNSMAVPAIRVLSPAVLFVCVLSAVRGYTQGQGNMRPTALSEIIESMTKLIVGMVLVWWLLGQGYSKYIGAAGAIAGVTVGTFLGMVTLLVYLLRRRRYRQSYDTPQSRRTILRRLLSIGVPITIGACGMTLLNLLDQSLVQGTLQNSLGLSESVATALYGEYTYAVNLFALPTAFIYPVTISLIPAITAALTRRDYRAAKSHTASAFRMTALLAIPAGVGLSVLAQPIMDLLYFAVPDTAAAAAEHLRVLGFASILVCFMTMTNAILQAYGKERIPLWTLLSGGVMKVVTNYLMVANPAIGIRGAPVSTLYCYGLIVLLNLIAIWRCVPEKPDYFQVFWRPALAAAVMGIAARCSYNLLCRVVSGRFAVLIAVMLAIVTYAVLAVALGAVTREDIAGLPKSEKWARFLRN
ncbi:MAG: polysaccharide biosynthesis protein [Eubacteriales bacterium]|nr:polysaccharide biosynthesis protein [Eubacteriales bacterium]